MPGPVGGSIKVLFARSSQIFYSSVWYCALRNSSRIQVRRILPWNSPLMLRLLVGSQNTGLANFPLISQRDPAAQFCVCTLHDLSSASYKPAKFRQNPHIVLVTMLSFVQFFSDHPLRFMSARLQFHKKKQKTQISMEQSQYC